MSRNDATITNILAGLSGDWNPGGQKEIVSSLHYDETGSRLFEKIIEQPEYYPLRAERLILSGSAAEILAAIPDFRAGPAALLELGASDDRKASFFLDAGRAQFSTYMPMNIEPSVLDGLQQTLRLTRPGLCVEPILTDFLAPFDVGRSDAHGTLIGFFSGSTIGQLDDAAAIRLLTIFRGAARPWPSVAFIVSGDVCRDPARLLPAYDDNAGMNSAFNLNALLHLNRIGDGDFDPSRFRHVVHWNEQENRMDFFLQSLSDQVCRFAEHSLHFGAGELVRSGVSYKRTHEAFRKLSTAAGWALRQYWTDPELLFGIHLLLPASKA